MNIQTIGHAIGKHCPKIFACTAVVGVVATTVLAVRETPKALRLLEQRKAELQKPVFTKKEAFRTAWRCYIPAAASGVITIASIIAGHSIQSSRNAQLAVAYGLSQTALRLYSDQLTENFGAEKAAAIRQRVGVQTMQMTEPPIGERFVLSGDSNDPKDKIIECFDYMGGRYFHASQNQILEAVEEFNETCVKTNGRGSLNQLYFCFHNPDELPPTGTGDLLGWIYKDGQGAIPMLTNDQDKHGNPCKVFDFYNPPRYDFDNEFA